MRTITLLEPLVTGLWKGSIRDDSRYNGRKSPFLAWDGDFQMRFELNDLDALFEQYLSGEGVADGGLGNQYYPVLVPRILSAKLHVQFAKPIIEIPRTIKYSWPRFRCFSVEHIGLGKIKFPVIRVGDVPHALMISHRVLKKGSWYEREHIPSYVNDSGCFVKELSIRHNLSRDNFSVLGDDRSKALQFITKKSFPDLPTNSLAYKHNQTVGLSRADLNITESAMRVLAEDGFIEMGIEMNLETRNSTRLGYTKHWQADPDEMDFGENTLLFPSFRMVPDNSNAITGLT